MKKLFMLLALVLGVVSCQNEPEGFDVVVGGEQDVNITVSLPESTRGTSSTGFDFTNFETNGTYDLRFILEIKHNDVTVKTVKTSNTTSVMFPVRLAPNREYTFTVWADLVLEGKDTDLHYNTANGLSNITFKGWTPNTEARDAYTKTMTKTFVAGTDLTMELTRPFAKVRVVATDIEDVSKFGLVPTSAVAEYFTAEMYTKFDAVNGSASEVATKKHEFSYTNDNKYDDVEGQFTVFTDYVFVPEDGNVQFTLNVNAESGLIKSNTFNTVIPVEANKVTSIIGSVLTEGGNVNITVDSDLGVKETFTYISSGAQLIAQMNAGGNFILGNDVTVTDADVTTRASRRNTANEAKKTTIDLNGYTITVKNTSDKPLVTIAAGNTLTFTDTTGKGSINMADGSTESFIENNGGNVVLESGEINNHENNNVPVIDGKIVVNEEANAELNDNNVSEENIIVNNAGWLADVLANGGTYVFTEDMTASEIIVVTATAPVVLDGNGKTLTSSAGRAINVSGAQNVTIKNLTINASGERAINIIQNATNITIDNVTATAANYTVNVATSAPGAVVTIKNSTLNGLCTVNVASARAEVTVDGSTVNCNDNNTTEGEAYAALSLNREAVGGKIIATNSTINVAEGSDSLAGRNGAEDGVVTINGSVEGVAVMNAVITYPDSNYYYAFETIAAAVDFAKSGDVISLIRDVELTESLEIAKDKNVVVDLNGKTLSGTMPKSVGHVVKNFGTLTIKNGTIASTGANGGSALYNEGVLTIEYATINGSSIRENNGWPSYPINNYSTMTVTNSTINGYQGAIACNAAGTTTVNNCTINKEYLDTSSHIFYIDHADAEVIVNGGTYTHKGMDGSLAYVNNGKITVNDGTFNTEGGGYGIAPLTNGKVTINGGTFNAGLLNWGGSIVITGGSFNADPAKYLAEGYYASKNGNYFEVKEGSLVSTAEALAAAFEKGGNIVLSADITVSEAVTLAIGKTAVLNLNGKTITATGYAIENYGTLTITGDGTINGVVYGENGTTTVENGTFNPADGGTYVFLNSQGGTLTINGGTINGGSSYPIYSYDDNSSLVINDVTVNATFGCVNAYGTNGSVLIKGGTFQMTGVQGNTSHIAYFSRNVVVTINGGTFEKIGDINMSGTGGGGICVNGGANLTINGGTFAGDYDDVYNWGGTISVKGGKYKFVPDFVADGYTATKDAENNTWTVVAK